MLSLLDLGSLLRYQGKKGQVGLRGAVAAVLGRQIDKSRRPPPRTGPIRYRPKRSKPMRPMMPTPRCRYSSPCRQNTSRSC